MIRCDCIAITYDRQSKMASVHLVEAALVVKQGDKTSGTILANQPSKMLDSHSLDHLLLFSFSTWFGHDVNSDDHVTALHG